MVLMQIAAIPLRLLVDAAMLVVIQYRVLHLNLIAVQAKYLMIALLAQHVSQMANINY